MSKNSCHTSFEIIGDFDLKEVAETIGLPYDGWNKTDIGRGGEPYGFSRLSLCVCDEYDVYSALQMEKTIAPLKDKVNLLNELREKYNLDYSLSVVPEISVDACEIQCDEVAPCLSPSLEVMEFCVSVHAELDIDYYLCDVPSAASD